MTPDNAILLDLANETARRFAHIPPGFPQKMARRLRRKFKAKVGADVIAELIGGYVSIYNFAASALKDCILPHTDVYASLSHVDGPKYMGKITAQFPAEDADILKIIAGWVIYYEYLR